MKDDSVGDNHSIEHEKHPERPTGNQQKSRQNDIGNTSEDKKDKENEVSSSNPTTATTIDPSSLEKDNKDTIKTNNSYNVGDIEQNDEKDNTKSNNSKKKKELEGDSNLKDEEESVKKYVVNYAHKSAGAIVLEKSSNFKGTSNLLTSDNDKYAITPCDEKNKSVVIGLSEDILVKQVVLANYERYSSHIKDFQLEGSTAYPIPKDGHWNDLGHYRATYGNGQQNFDLMEPSWARYIKINFKTHYGDEHYCTVSQVKVHGSTMLQGFHEQWKQTEESEEEFGDDLDVLVESTNNEAEITEDGIQTEDLSHHDQNEISSTMSESNNDTDVINEEENVVKSEENHNGRREDSSSGVNDIKNEIPSQQQHTSTTGEDIETQIDEKNEKYSSKVEDKSSESEEEVLEKDSEQQNQHQEEIIGVIDESSSAKINDEKVPKTTTTTPNEDYTEVESLRGVDGDIETENLIDDNVVRNNSTPSYDTPKSTLSHSPITSTSTEAEQSNDDKQTKDDPLDSMLDSSKKQETDNDIISKEPDVYTKQSSEKLPPDTDILDDSILVNDLIDKSTPNSSSSSLSNITLPTNENLNRDDKKPENSVENFVDSSENAKSNPPADIPSEATDNISIPDNMEDDETNTISVIYEEGVDVKLKNGQTRTVGIEEENRISTDEMSSNIENSVDVETPEHPSSDTTNSLDSENHKNSSSSLPSSNNTFSETSYDTSKDESEILSKSSPGANHADEINTEHLNSPSQQTQNPIDSSNDSINDDSLSAVSEDAYYISKISGAIIQKIKEGTITVHDAVKKITESSSTKHSSNGLTEVSKGTIKHITNTIKDMISSSDQKIDVDDDLLSDDDSNKNSKHLDQTIENEEIGTISNLPQQKEENTNNAKKISDEEAADSSLNGKLSTGQNENTKNFEKNETIESKRVVDTNTKDPSSTHQDDALKSSSSSSSNKNLDDNGRRNINNENVGDNRISKPNKTTTSTPGNAATAASSSRTQQQQNSIPTSMTANTSVSGSATTKTQSSSTSPSMNCMDIIRSFNDFKTKMLAQKKSVAGANSNSPQVMKMEPIFKTITDQIKTLQVHQSIYDSYFKSLTGCYEEIISEMQLETTKLKSKMVSMESSNDQFQSSLKQEQNTRMDEIEKNMNQLQTMLHKQHETFLNQQQKEELSLSRSIGKVAANAGIHTLAGLISTFYSQAVIPWGCFVFKQSKRIGSSLLNQFNIILSSKVLSHDIMTRRVDLLQTKKKELDAIVSEIIEKHVLAICNNRAVFIGELTKFTLYVGLALFVSMLSILVIVFFLIIRKFVRYKKEKCDDAPISFNNTNTVIVKEEKPTIPATITCEIEHKSQYQSSHQKDCRSSDAASFTTL
eukprot:CAMPEP_0178976578 /NCGR_PEP_ID=MMETSP0789-20121207/23925_1 /TAXON_ID=3005 /ORGANISM="Rhizosolenia setigera, Strain CCMP 1694" /LENGTH=1363 /DNA_ID=CAMNT_0020665709 /DNA_START=214 /DNA_END=4305 /DNA_ORIENTATION=-